MFSIGQLSCFVFENIIIKPLALLNFDPSLSPVFTGCDWLILTSLYCCGTDGHNAVAIDLELVWVWYRFFYPTSSPVYYIVFSISVAVTTVSDAATTILISISASLDAVSAISAISSWVLIAVSCLTTVSLVSISAAYLISTITQPVLFLAIAVSQLPVFLYFLITLQ